MFAYCNNNPIIFSDPSGCLFFLVVGMENSGFHARSLQEYTGTGGSGIASSKTGSQEVVQREIDFLNNTSEQVVLESNYFAFYKGNLVVRIKGERSGSFGIIFLTYETNARDCPEDVVRHEYGHIQQLKMLGIVNFALCIGLPSWREWGTNPSYYDRPWEVTADIMGGVVSRTHSNATILDGIAYLLGSAAYSILVWTTIE